jgi:triacylglycerol lipase
MPFDPLMSKHTPANALAMAECCHLAYSSDAVVRNGVAVAIGGGRTLKEFKFLDIPLTNTQGFMAGFEDAIVLCFRGTDHVGDWLHNAQVQLVPFQELGRVHAGFRGAFESVRMEIEATLAEWAGHGRTFWITGHSLGGALALYTSAHLRFPLDRGARVPQPIAGLYTFGQPRVGTVDFCNACEVDFGSRYFRYTNNQDIVTRVPPRELKYWHTGKDLYIDGTGAIHEDPAWWQRFIDLVAAGVEALRSLRDRNPHIKQIKDHAMENYVAALRKHVD